MLSCLVEVNQAWAQNASALVLSVTRLAFMRNGKPNAMARHDLGLATGQLTIEAVSRGLAVHPMGGIVPDRIRELYGIPEGFEPVTGLAIGFAAAAESLPEALQRREMAERVRRPQREFVFGGSWEQPAALD
jgi:nitroreductase